MSFVTLLENAQSGVLVVSNRQELDKSQLTTKVEKIVYANGRLLS